VKAGVSKVIQGVHERVLTVTGPVDGVSKVCSTFRCHRSCLLFTNDTLGLHSHYLAARDIGTVLPRHRHLIIFSYFHSSSRFP
jgi:hypothetical protein